MKNPVSQFRSNLFASRGCDIQSALDYCEVMINTLNQTDQVAARTAIGVLLNTIDNAVAQVVDAPSPEKLALIELIDQRIGESFNRKIDDGVFDDLIESWINSNFDIGDNINDWMSSNFDLSDYSINDAINDWMSDNLADKISDIDLVVRAR